MIAVSLLFFVSSVSFASVPGIVGQDDGGTSNSPVNFNTGEGSEMSGGHRVSVNVTTGNLTVKHTDLVIPTKGPDIVIERTYNSLEMMNGVERGFEIVWDGAIPGASYITVTAGTCWINGERVTMQSDYPIGVGGNGWSWDENIYVVNNFDGTASITYTGTSPDSMPDNTYRIGHFDGSRTEDDGLLWLSYYSTGISLNNGKIFGANLTFSHMNQGREDDKYYADLSAGLVVINGEKYSIPEKLNVLVWDTGGGVSSDHYFVLNPNPATSIANVQVLTSSPDHTNYPNGYLLVGHYVQSGGAINSDKANNLGRRYHTAFSQEPKLGTDGKWRFNFESYATRTLGGGTWNNYVHNLYFKDGSGTSHKVETEEGLFLSPVSGHTDKRAYLNGSHEVPGSFPDYVGFVLPSTYFIGEQPLYSGRSKFELTNLRDETLVYYGVLTNLASIENDNADELYRDEAVLTEKIDANGNRIIYEWNDGSPTDTSSGKFAGLDGTGEERDYYLNKIFDDSDYDGNPDSVQVLFSYNSSNFITSIIVTDANGSYPEVVAEYEYDANEDLVGYTDFHGRHFSYAHAYAGTENPFLTGITDDVGGVLSVSCYMPLHR